ncbi:MAG: hypothetical protein AAF462_09595 [Thermodesulfobacteriota bacterium]
MSKKKEENISAKRPKKAKKPSNKGRLSSMLESMQKRSSPVNAHKVATKYFDDFKKDRSITEDNKNTAVITSVDKDDLRASSENVATSVDIAKDTAVNIPIETVVDTAVPTDVPNKEKKPSPSKSQNRQNKRQILDDSHTNSEKKVYWAMRDECESKKTQELRFGLKQLKEKTGLSDKTVRNTIHNLEEKLSISIIEPSLGIYGRKMIVHMPDEILENRKKDKLEIDITTKKVISSNSAIVSKVNSAVNSMVDTTVNNKKNIQELYNKYTGKKWDQKAEKFYQNIQDIKIQTIEAAFILGILKENKRNKHLTEFRTIINDIGNDITDTYLTHLKQIWKNNKD